MAAAKAAQKLQMPPVMSVRKPIKEVLSRDPELQGYLKHKYVFIDISPDESARDRMITVRETDGTLRKADWDERTRLNQIFYPLPGRNLETPKMYESPYFECLLEDGAYKFILDSACCQFEPDDPEYHRITTATYEHIRDKKKFDELRSTRHFGPMAFHFAVTKNIDSLLIDMIEHNLISDAFDYIQLLYLTHKDMPVPKDFEENNEMEVIKDYIKNHASQKGNLELVLQSYLEKSFKSNEEVSV
ncbi:small ribosomal subunit protein mS22 isoform X2 [Parasteatoda tepidariorum]